MTLRTIGLVGCGAMAGAMLARWIATETIAARDVFVVNTADRALPDGVAQGRAFPADAQFDAVMIGVKPQQLGEAIAAHGETLAAAPLLLSILAGTREADLIAATGAGSVVRAMPNLPVAIGRGVVSLCGTSASADHRSSVTLLMAPLGLVEWVDEPLFDAATALAGSGPAFVYRFIDALSAGGAALGLDPAQALRMALATVVGAARLAEDAREQPGVLADRVASKGGSTRAGLDVLDDDAALARLVEETLAAAERRNRELAALNTR